MINQRMNIAADLRLTLDSQSREWNEVDGQQTMNDKPEKEHRGGLEVEGRWLEQRKTR